MDNANIALAIVHIQGGISALEEALVDLRRALRDTNRRSFHLSRAIDHWDPACRILREARTHLVKPSEEPPNGGG